LLVEVLLCNQKTHDQSGDTSSRTGSWPDFVPSTHFEFFWIENYFLEWGMDLHYVVTPFSILKKMTKIQNNNLYPFWSVQYSSGTLVFACTPPGTLFCLYCTGVYIFCLYWVHCFNWTLEYTFFLNIYIFTFVAFLMTSQGT
jgi:hypothetical protein